MVADIKATISDLLSEKTLWPQMLLEDYLTVALDLRQCSLTTIPAELPDADSLSRRIDEKCIPDFKGVTQEKDPQNRMRMIRIVKDKLRKAYLEEIKGSPSYRSHIFWVKRLGLEVFEVEVRPTVREHFVHKQKETKNRIEFLTRKREEFREEFLKHVDRSIPRSIAAYPEERFPEYLTQIGELLGYPKCCVEAYIEGRAEGSPIAEQRAATQIADVKAQGLEPDIYAYFSRDFIPCSPMCSNASTIGKEIHQAFSGLSDRLSQVYGQCLKGNIETVGSYPQRIQAHKVEIERRSRKLGISE